MLTFVKVTTTERRGGGYEPFNDFCIVRDAEKYMPGCYIAKVLNRFEDCHGDEHYVVVPVSDKPITCINYDLARQICKAEPAGIEFIGEQEFPEDVDTDDYDEMVQYYLESIA